MRLPPPREKPLVGYVQPLPGASFVTPGARPSEHHSRCKHNPKLFCFRFGRCEACPIHNQRYIPFAAWKDKTWQ
jgi:hypothetical protein